MIPRNFRQNLIYFLARKLLQILKEGLTFEKELNVVYFTPNEIRSNEETKFCQVFQ